MRNGLPRILIVRLSTIGDVVRVVPALHSLRNAYPDAQIDWVVERKAADVVEGHPALDTLVVFDRDEGFANSTRAILRLLQEVRRRKYDIVVDFQGVLKSGMIVGASRAPKRFGFARPRAELGSVLFTNDRVNVDGGRMNRIEENLALAHAVGGGHAPRRMTLHVPNDIEVEVFEYINMEVDSAKRLVVMHVTGDRPDRLWPKEYYAELADLLIADGRFEVILTWGPGERDAVEAVRSLSRRDPKVAPEMERLKYYMGLVEQADLYVGGGAGPMQIASLLGTPVVAIFMGMDPVRDRPLYSPAVILSADESEVRREGGEGSSGDELLNPIVPERVYEACVEVLFGSRVSGMVPRGT